MEVIPTHWIFLRGLARETRHWGDFPQLFQEAFPHTKNYVLELPGVGKKYNESAPLQLESYVDQLRTQWLELKKDTSERWGILSISMGSMLAMTWAARYPHDFQEGVLINSSAGNLSSLKERFSPQAMKMVSKLFFKEDYWEREREILNLTTHKILVTDKLISEYAEYSRQYPIKRKNFMAQIYAASKFKVPLKLPFDPIILNGRHDALASPKCSDILGKHFNVPVYRDELSGHDLPLDHPKWIIEVLSQKFKKEID